MPSDRKSLNRFVLPYHNIKPTCAVLLNLRFMLELFPMILLKKISMQKFRLWPDLKDSNGFFLYLARVWSMYTQKRHMYVRSIKYLATKLQPSRYAKCRKLKNYLLLISGSVKCRKVFSLNVTTFPTLTTSFEMTSRQLRSQTHLYESSRGSQRKSMLEPQGFARHGCGQLSIFSPASASANTCNGLSLMITYQMRRHICT